jgi:hypothetical protein
MWRKRDMYLATSRDAVRTFAAAQKLGTGTWKLNGCPVDGGSIALRADEKLLTAWRREKTAFSAEPGENEQPLSDSGSQPIVVTTASGPTYLWQEGGDLFLKKDGSTPAVFASNAAYASAATLPDGRAVVVWESSGSGAKTLLAEVLD